MRQLANGTRYEILQNFPSNAALQDTCVPYATTFEIINCTYFWLVRYAGQVAL
jgi:hypothetical protein